MLHKALLGCQPEGRIHLSHRLSSYEEIENEVRLNFTDGTTATCDMLVGADGIRSIVRRSLVQRQLQSSTPALEAENAGDAVWSGTYAYRGLISFERLGSLFPDHRAIQTPLMVSEK
jgi:salicylate hydroxylase